MAGRADMPSHVHWELTYSCPLRCVHCYTESGRRPSRQPKPDVLLRIADVLVSMVPQGLKMIGIGSGEPLIVEEFPRIADRLTQGGLNVFVNTSGYGLTPELAAAMTSLFAVHVSIDAATAPVNDWIRGRKGAFERALSALAILEEVARTRRESGHSPLRFGIDAVLTRDSFDDIPRFLSDICGRFTEMKFIFFGAVIPIGLASRETYESQLLTDEQLRLLADDEFVSRMKQYARPDLQVCFSDNLMFQMNPSRQEFPVITIEPDGMVRGLTAYEGHVGNILNDSPDMLWRQVCALREHPFVVDQLSSVRTPSDWAAAARAIDRRFASPKELIRLSKRPPYVPKPD